MIYGPAVDDGCKNLKNECSNKETTMSLICLDGCCYNPRNDSINYMVTAFKINNQGTNVKEFSETFNQTLNDIQKLIEFNAPKPIKSKL